MAKRLPKASELSYHGSENAGEERARSIVAAHEGRVVGFLKSSMEPAGGGGSTNRELSMAWVDPKYQRRGIGSTMLGLEKYRTGYMPVGDRTLSKKGSAFQKGSGVPTNPRGEYVDLPAASFPPEISHTIQEKQGHMLHEKQFEPWLVKAAGPYKAPRRKQQPEPEQPMLPGTERY